MNGDFLKRRAKLSKLVNNITFGDCLEVMKRIPDESIDMILCDLPYGTTQCKWDTIIPFEPMWEQYKRIVKPKSAIVLTASQPFTSFLVASNPKWFRYEWIWEKSKASNFLDAKKRPLKAHESILVFGKQNPNYYPQKTEGKPFKGEGRTKKGSKTDLVGNVPNPTFRNDNKGDRYPRSVVYFKTAESEGKVYHNTQKPLALFEYLIKTYTQENDIILDNCIGSGTTAIAARSTNRRFVGIENDEEMYGKAIERLSKC